MLAGTAAKKHNTTNDTSRDNKRASDKDQDHNNRNEMGRNHSHNAAAVTKRFRALLTTFAFTVSKEWLYNNDQLSTVISSIDNVRQRLPVIYRQWVQRKKQRQGRLQVVPLWKQQYNGAFKVSPTFTGSHSSLAVQLTEEDLCFTLHHELQNHEKYLTYVRKLLLQMSDAVQTASRQLDALFLFYQQHADTLATAYASYDYTASFLLDLACDVFLILSRELYRRQTLAQTELLNTGRDQLLPEEDTQDGTIPRSSGSLSDPTTSSYATSSLVSQNDGIGTKETMRLELFLEISLHQTNSKNIE